MHRAVCFRSDDDFGHCDALRKCGAVCRWLAFDYADAVSFGLIFGQDFVSEEAKRCRNHWAEQQGDEEGRAELGDVHITRANRKASTNKTTDERMRC